jgi:hypothetical protein
MITVDETTSRAMVAVARSRDVSYWHETDMADLDGDVRSSG